MNLKNKYTQALNKFLEVEKNGEEVIGIFVTGSYAKNCLKNNSDIDVYIVTNDKNTQILAKYYDDIEFECCYKPLEQFFYDLELKNDFDVQRYSTALILYDPKRELEKIIDLAKKTYNQGSQREITDSDLYHLEDNFKDLTDVFYENTARIFMYKCFEKLLKIYFKKMNLWECKEKYYYEYIKKYDEPFSIKVKHFLETEKRINQYQLLIEMKKEVLKDIKPLNKNWKTSEVLAPVFKK